MDTFARLRSLQPRTLPVSIANSGPRRTDLDAMLQPLFEQLDL
jgi:hypothetical protein